jgi:diguanylate cyclase (GGDEF)-like protein
MGTDRSEDPFPSLEEAAAALRSAPELGDLGRRLLATLLAADRRAEQARERAERAEAAASTDVLTGVRNRREWDRLLEAEERRCARYGHTACVVVVDLDELKAINDSAGHRAGDELLTAAAGALTSASRATDTVARVGGDEFALLAVDTDLETGRVLVRRLAEALAAGAVKASVGLAERTPQGGMAGAWTEADRHMYAAKRRRSSSRAE